MLTQEILRQQVEAEEQWLLDSISKLVGAEADSFKKLISNLKEDPSSKIAIGGLKGFLDGHKITIVKMPQRRLGNTEWRQMETVILKDDVIVKRFLCGP